MSRRLSLVLFVACVALVVSGCQAGAEKTRKVLPEWSRGVQLGTAGLNRPVHIVAEDDRVHMVWVAAETNVLHYVRLDRSGDVEVSRDLDLASAHPSDPRLLLYADGSLGVIWTDNPSIPRALFQARCDRSGDVLGDPKQLTPEGVQVGDFAVVSSEDGAVHVFWSNDIPAEGGLHYLPVSASGQIDGPDTLLVAAGETPDARQDGSGLIHLSWVVEPSIRLNYVYYAVFDPDNNRLGPETQVALYKTATGLISYPPVIGLDESMVYLFWSLEQRGGGMSPGESQAYYTAFPIGSPRDVEPLQIAIPPVARPQYHDVEGTLPYRQLASASPGWSSSFVYQPATPIVQGAELGVFLVAEVATQREASKEVVWAIYSNGEMKGYQLPTVLGRSLRPTCAIDEQGNVHLAWLSSGGFGRYDVNYASTSDAVKAHLDAITIQDRAADTLDALWAVAPAFGFFPPVFLLWSFASFVWVVLFYFVRVEGGLDRRSAQIALVIAIGLYLFSKLFLLPGPLFYAPFRDRLPPNLEFLPVVITPIFTLLVALGAVGVYFSRRAHRSLFAAFVLFVVTDALLSLMIYVPRWLAG